MKLSPDRKVLATLNKAHPRLILTDARLAEIKEQAKTDQLLARSIQDVLKRADELCAEPQRSDRRQPRLIRPVYALALAWRLTGKDAYAKKAKEILLAACRKDDWGGAPNSFLDAAQLTHAVAIGYDWLYHYLDAKTRREIKAGLIRNGIDPGLAAYRSQAYWMTKPWNWNHVCNGGLIIGALAIADSEPARAGKVISQAVASLPNGLASYEPDGAWGEGPGYWAFATAYTVYCLAALQTALGTDFGLSRSKGLTQTGYFPTYVTGPTKQCFDFADAHGTAFPAAPFLHWLAKRYDLADLAAIAIESLEKRPAEPEDVIWYCKGQKEKPFALPLDKLFGGPVEMAVFRSAWNDPAALFLAIKAGAVQEVGHAQLDMGTFVLDALGVRWAMDLGSDDYNLPGYWLKETSSAKRWTYYRMGSASHNVPLLNGANQDALAKTKIIRFQAEQGQALVLLDLTSAYAAYASDAKRGVALIDGHRAVLVQDEFELTNACELAWGMTTEADITVQGATAHLTRDGEALRAELLCPAGGEFAVESAEQAPPQATNKGVRRLVVRLGNQTQKVRLAVLLSPVWPDGKAVTAPELKPLSEW